MDRDVPNRLVALDIETSGVDEDEHSLLSLGMVHPRTGEEWYAEIHYPGTIEWEDQAMAINDIEWGDINDPENPTIDEADLIAAEWLKETTGIETDDHIAIGFNVGGFDMQFVEEQMPRLDALFDYEVRELNTALSIVDYVEDEPEKTHKRFYKDITSNEREHNALWDARQAVELLVCVVNHLGNSEWSTPKA
jgi:oligoribonuclease (3'-5' exoribonuclease)